MPTDQIQSDTLIIALTHLFEELNVVLSPERHQQRVQELFDRAQGKANETVQNS